MKKIFLFLFLGKTYYALKSLILSPFVKPDNLVVSVNDRKVLVSLVSLKWNVEISAVYYEPQMAITNACKIRNLFIDNPFPQIINFGPFQYKATKDNASIIANAMVSAAHSCETV